MTNRRTLYRTMAIAGLAATVALSARGGSLTPSGPPASTMRTLEEIYQKIEENNQLLRSIGGVVPPANMVFIPAGSFVMGDTMGDQYFSIGDDETTIRTNYLAAFLIDRYEVVKSLWDEVRAYNGTNGFSYSTNAAVGKAANHPVVNVTWYDAVKWCNARSLKEGLRPVYYTDNELSAVYKSGEGLTIYPDWGANGYRLPTEAEWEKAARAGASGTRFPWVDFTNRISFAKANYQGNGNGEFAYDLAGITSYHPSYATNGTPYTSPVGSFGANAYGLYDMAGNAYEWCWDWYDAGYYFASSGIDPHGPATGTQRVLRGGSWQSFAIEVRMAYRGKLPPDAVGAVYGLTSGLRCVRTH